MIIVEVKENESIERAIRRYRRKRRDINLRNELLRRKEYTKPSIRRRNEVLKAIYKNKREEEN